MPETFDPAPYDTRLDNKYGYLTVIDIPAEVAAHEPWFNQTLTQVNDSVVRLGILESEYHWHKHDNEDECFVVLDGQSSRCVADVPPTSRSRGDGRAMGAPCAGPTIF